MPTARIQRRGPNQKLRGARPQRLKPQEEAESERLRILCIQKEISRYDVAKAVGLSPQTCGKWLAMQCLLRPDYQLLLKAAYPVLACS
jgi:hypothetical protein